MRLVEALASGRKFRKVGSTGTYTFDATSSFTGADVVSGEFELAPDIAKSLTLAQITQAWNSSIPASGSVAVAAESAMFTRIKTALGF